MCNSFLVNVDLGGTSKSVMLRGGKRRLTSFPVKGVGGGCVTQMTPNGRDLMVPLKDGTALAVSSATVNDLPGKGCRLMLASVDNVA